MLKEEGLSMGNESLESADPVSKKAQLLIGGGEYNDGPSALLALPCAYLRYVFQFLDISMTITILLLEQFATHYPQTVLACHRIHGKFLSDAQL